MMDARSLYGSDYVQAGDHAPVPAIEGTSEEVFGANSIAYFPTYERDIYYKGKTGEEFHIPSKKAIVRTMDDDEGKPYPVTLGVVGKNYKVISMKDVCDAAEEQYKHTLTDHELSRVQRRDRIAHYGSTCIRDYVFPNIRTDVGKRSDVSFRSVIVNGYDGSSSFRVYSGAIDFFCENRLVTGSFDMSIYRHTGGFRIPDMADRIRASIDVFYKQSDIWAGWSDKEISNEDAKACFESIPGISERRVEQLMRQFQIECSAHGRTVWAMYSAATFFASQSKGAFGVRDTGNDHLESTLMNRENQINKWTDTDEFMKIAA